MKRFQDKVVVITGAASGIGRAGALRLAEEGADIVALDLSQEGLSSLTAEIASMGRRCETVAGSVADLDIVEAAIVRAVDVFDGLDGLVNNAGIGGPMQRFDKVAPNDFDKMISINLKSAWRGMQLAYAPMRNRGGGAILNVASIGGIRPSRHHALYGMTKAAMISLMHHAAMDYAAANIRVNCLCPGPVETPIFKKMMQNLEPEAYEAARRHIREHTLLNRFSEAKEQAAAIAYLLSDEASFVTGVAMPVDGGWAISDGRVA